MSSNKVPKVTAVLRKGRDLSKVVRVYVDDVEMKAVTNFKWESPADSLPRITIEMVGELELVDEEAHDG